MRAPVRWDYLLGQCLVSVIVVLITGDKVTGHLSTESAPGDGCDWTGSGLSSTDSGRSVTPVYLRCAQGQVTWVYPRGALRVLLRLGASGRDFRGCLKVDPDFGGARVFLEGARSLSLLHGGGGGDDAAAPKQLARCFQSRRGQVALYVEADSNREEVVRRVAAFYYDLQAVAKAGTYYDSDEDCRPCFPEEMVQLYCTSDFVARGIITSVANNAAMNRAEVATRVDVVYRQLDHNIFHYQDGGDAVEHALLRKNNYHRYDVIARNNINASMVNVTRMSNNVTNSVLNYSLNELDFRDFDSSFLYGTVFVPLHCEAKFGVGEFVFMGRMVLGDPYLSCSPRLEDWVGIRRKAMESGDAQCILET